eukprot:TRINITY_DN36655_c0_g1_i2.p1 TRINITY_DN36655_c0_g1~~TRINITY_DN36655_c0_g1_i2.p1  ORF type:complete len:307 (+),score=80.85 TRINITY_DN36655_c0_g1_i2:94-1014(+)
MLRSLVGSEMCIRDSLTRFISSFSRFRQQGFFSLFNPKLAVNSSLKLRSPWHHRCMIMWFGSGILIWSASGALYILYADVDDAYCADTKPCYFGGFNIATQIVRILAGVITLVWNVILLWVSKETALNVDDYGVDMGPANSDGYGALQKEDEQEEEAIVALPSANVPTPLPHQLVDADEGGAFETYELGLNAFTFKILFGLILSFDLVCCLVSASILASTQPNEQGWQCKRCGIMYFHAASWVVVMPYCIVLVMVWGINTCCTVDKMISTDFEAEQQALAARKSTLKVKRGPRGAWTEQDRLLVQK